MFRRQTKTQTNISEYGYINIKIDKMEEKRIMDIKNKVSLEEIIKFIYKELSEDRPLAFLNLCNGEENNLDKWHWVVIVEMFEENGEHFLNIIDDKEIIKINLSLWYRTIKNDGGFITFK